MIELTEDGDTERALKIMAYTIGITLGIAIGHNALCIAAETNCGTSWFYFL